MICGLFLAASLAAADFTVLEQDVAPQVAYAIDGGAMTLRVDNPYAAVRGRFVVARDRVRTIDLTNFPATVRLDAPELGSGKTLRMGLELSWFRPDGSLRERRVYFSQPEEGRLPSATDRLAVFDLKGYEQRRADRRSRILLPFEQPQDGFATVVIEDDKGRRLRNLVSSLPFKKGPNQVEWDGYDDFGNQVAPGTYRYRGLTHAGVTYDFLMQFANGDESMAENWGANHEMMTALAANSNYVFTASRLTEGGYAVVGLSREGKFRRGYQQAHWRGVDYVSLAADEQHLYLAMQGHSFNEQPDVRARFALAVYDVETDKITLVNKKPSNFIYASPTLVDKDGKDLLRKQDFKRRLLTGLAVLNGKLYLANAESETVMVIDPQTATVEKEYKVAQPCAPVVVDGRLHVASGRDLMALDPATDAFVKRFTLPFAPTSLAYQSGRFAVLGAADSTVRFFSKDGRETGTLGEPGGDYAGAWRPKRLVKPVDVAFAADGKLWTAEKRENPKRVVRWDPSSGEILYAKYGCPGYGAPSLGFDGNDGTRVIAENVEWKIDYAKKTATPVNVLWKTGGVAGWFGKPLTVQLARYQGREYVISMGHVVAVSEVQPDGSLKAMMAFSNFFHMDKQSGSRCPALHEFAARNYPKFYVDVRRWFNYHPGVCWVDANGNGEIEVDEIALMPKGDPVLAFWNITTMGLDIKFPFRDADGTERIVTLAPNGRRANGVLDYDLARAFRESSVLKDELPMGGKGIGTAGTANDLRGNVLLNTSPWMLSLTGDGRINWHYPNRWNDVHGSHRAPMPERGMFIGYLFALGTAPLDRQGDVTAIIGNTGMVFLMTTDGLFIDQLFHDGRVYSSMDFNNLHGEPFGGSFQYDRKARKYRLQAGHGGYRLYDLSGLETVKRFAGEVTVTRPQLESAARRRREQEKAAEEAAITKIVRQTKVNYNKLPQVAQWTQGALRCTVNGAYDERELCLRWRVEDPSPWRNTGKDASLLFKTGDSVDLQLALDKSLTEKNRRAAAPGDIRLLIAPFEGKDTVVLYRYRVKAGEKGTNPTGFSSPWRTYTVQDVKTLKSAGAVVQKTMSGYTVTLRLPLSELGVTADELQGVHRGDFGVIFGDSAGKVNMSRSYWANKETGLVNDIPGEIEPAVKNWGVIEFGGAK